MPNLKTASVLAFERKLDPSDALLYAGSWEDRKSPRAPWPAIEVNHKSVRGTISNRLKGTDEDPAKLNAAIENANLQEVDIAALPAGADTLKVMFTLRVLGDVGIPSACNNTEYRAKLLAKVAGYKAEVGYDELASRYAHNLANARFLWRNRVGAEAVEVQVQQWQEGRALNTWTFDALALKLREFTAETGDQAEKLKSLGQLIAKVLAGDKHVLLQVTAFTRLGAGQEVFPSQELILDGKKGKILYAVSSVAGIHSQKLGNALRTIDTWHSDVTELGPIAVEPYGSVTTLGKACRRPTDKQDFYSLLDNWILKDEKPAPDQQHFVMAMLIRGGVFGKAKKTKPKKNRNKQS